MTAVLCALAGAARTYRRGGWSAWSENAETFSPLIESILANMTLEQTIGQMVQLDISLIRDWNSGTTVNSSLIQHYMENYFVGSFLNNPEAGGPDGATVCPTSAEYLAIVDAINAVATTTGARIPVLYGLDSVHGAAYIHDATIFPQPNAVAATFNRSAATAMGAYAAAETRAAGIAWAFAPILDLATQPIWPRVYETFGEV